MCSSDLLKAQAAAVGERRDEMATEALPGGLVSTGSGPEAPSTARRRPGGSGLVLPTQAHVSPSVNGCLLPDTAGLGTGAPASVAWPQGTAPELPGPAFAAIAPRRAGSCPPPAGRAPAHTAAGGAQRPLPGSTAHAAAATAVGGSLESVAWSGQLARSQWG